MSNTDGMRVWVGDLDDYIDIEQINRWNEREEEEAALQDAIDAIGELPLLDGCKTDASRLNAKGITPDEWQWAVHEAEKALSESDQSYYLERVLIHGLLGIGRPYATGRYAHWERLSLASAQTAVLPFGHLALVDQHLSTLASAAAPAARRTVRAAIKEAESAGDLVAYERTALVRTAILEAVDIERAGEFGRESMRILLSLTRLRFSAAEANVRSFNEITALNDRYEAARRRAAIVAPDAPDGARKIRNWSLRHMHPLTFLMPVDRRGKGTPLAG